MTSIHVDLDSIEWTPGSAYKGPDALYRDQEVFYRKVLSDRRQQGGGLACTNRIAESPVINLNPPPRIPGLMGPTCCARADEMIK